MFEIKVLRYYYIVFFSRCQPFGFLFAKKTEDYSFQTVKLCSTGSFVQMETR